MKQNPPIITSAEEMLKKVAMGMSISGIDFGSQKKANMRALSPFFRKRQRKAMFSTFFSQVYTYNPSLVFYRLFFHLCRSSRNTARQISILFMGNPL